MSHKINITNIHKIFINFFTQTYEKTQLSKFHTKTFIKPRRNILNQKLKISLCLTTAGSPKSRLGVGTLNKEASGDTKGSMGG